MPRLWDWIRKGAPVPPPTDPGWVESFFTPYVPGATQRASSSSGYGSRPGYATPQTSRQGPPAGAGRTPSGGEAHQVPYADPAKFFDLQMLWALIRQGRDAAFVKQARECKKEDGEAILPLAQLVEPKEKRNLKLFKFFNLPLEEARKHVELDPWEDWLQPFLNDIEVKLMKAMPPDISKYDGVLEFGETGDGAFGLLYWECEGI